MKCPTIEVLRQSLESDRFDTDPDLATHIAQCSECQSQLNQLSDDAELAQWRDIDSSLQHAALSEAACQAVIERMRADQSTNASSTIDTVHIEDLRLDAPLASGDLGRLGDYRIIRQLGQGGMAVVLEAIDIRLDRAVAIKVLRPDRLTMRQRERFVREARALAKIKHPQVIDIYHVADPSDGPPYFVTELMQRTLSSLIRSEQLEARTAAHLIALVAEGLQAAHDIGLIHRDVKPSNILISTDPKSKQWLPKLSDFGLAKTLETSLDTTHTVGLAGTPAYMSPEQVTLPAEATVASDIYSLGISLFEALTGELPFRGAPHAVLHQITHEEVPWLHRFNPHVPRELELICLKSVASDPNQRYRSAAALAADLRNWLAGRPIMARPPGQLGRFARWCRRNSRVAWLSGLVLSLMVLLTVGSLLAALMIMSSQSALKERTAAAENAQRTAEKAQQSAAEAAAQADQQRRITLDTLNELVGNVQKQLEKRPETAQLRQSLLNKAFEGLQSVTQALQDQEQIDRTMIDAYIQMAQIKLEFADRESAIEQSSKAIALAEKTVAQEPANIECLRDLGNALTTQFEIYSGAFANTKALEVAERIAEIRQRICEQIPVDASAARSLIATRQRIADIQVSEGKLQLGLQSFISLLAQLEEIQRRVGDALDLRRDRCILLNRVGSLYLQTGDAKKAESMYAASRQQVEQMLAQDSDNIIFQADHAFVLGRLAFLASTQGQHELALERAQATSLVYHELVKRDPDRIQFQTLLGTSYDLQFQILLAKGDLADAIEAEQRSLEIATANCDRDPSSSRYLLLAAEAAQKIGEVHIRQEQLADAREYMTRAVDLIARTHATSDYVASSVESIESSYKRLLAAVELAMAGSETCHAQLQDRPEVARLALGILAYGYAVQGKVAQARSTVQAMLALEPLAKEIQAAHLMIFIRTLSICLRQADETLRLELQREVLSATQACIECMPNLKTYLRFERDLIPIQSLPEFQEIVK